jgi:MFS family permease
MQNKALRALYLYNGIFTIAAGLFGPLYAIYVQQFIPVTNTTEIVIVSFSWAAFLISATLFTFIVSKFGDQVKETEYLLMYGYIIRAIVWFLYIFVHSFTFLIILQILLGLGEALGSPSFDTLMSEHVDRGHKVEEYADMKIIFNLGGALATFLGGLIVARFGFPYLFVIMSALSLISFIGILFKPRNLL